MFNPQRASILGYKMFRVLFLLIAIIPAYLGYTLFFPYTVTKNFRLMVTLDVNGAEKTFSSVQQNRYVKFANWFPSARSGKQEYFGEALEILLPGKPPILVLMLGKHRDSPLFYGNFLTVNCEILDDGLHNWPDNYDFYRKHEEFDGSCIVPPENYPFFATITDYGDWSTFRLLEPSPVNHTLLDDVRIVSISLKTTREDVTRDFRKKFRASAEQRNILARSTPSNLPQNISNRHFIKE
jgi:hypothetical protein